MSASLSTLSSVSSSGSSSGPSSASQIRKVAVLDFETTSLNADVGQIIEGAVALVEIGADGSWGETTETYWSFNDPGEPITAEITKLTGITDEMVRGHKLDWTRFTDLLDRAQLLIAHNAAFDRSWLERHAEYKVPHWACSLRQVDWSELHDMPCRTLKHLAWESGFFPNAHRAIDDVETLVRLLRTPSRGNPAQTYGMELLASAGIRKHLVYATGAPFETKDTLKAAGFRWSPEKRVWWKLAPASELELLNHFLSTQVYSGHPRHTVTEPVDELDPGFRARYGLGT